MPVRKDFASSVPNQKSKIANLKLLPPSETIAFFPENAIFVPRMKEQYIAAKERWARKMAGKEKSAVRSTNRLPPGQRQVHNFPVLDLGVRPEVPLAQQELKI